jgi:tRNA(His) guanylyltransferase
MSKDIFGDRMKEHEASCTSTRLDRNLPVYLRLDGRSFSKLTKPFQRPHDPKFAWAMSDTAKKVMAEFHADIAYFQSDEISLGWFPLNEAESPIFDYKIFKLTSVIAAFASVVLYQNLIKLGGLYAERAMKMIPHLDARVFNVPSNLELINSFVWREHDALKNNVQLLARYNIGHKTMQGRPNSEVKQMLLEKGIDFDQLPNWRRSGTWFIRKGMNVSTPNGDVIRKKIVKFRDIPSTTAEKLIVYGGMEQIYV